MALAPCAFLTYRSKEGCQLFRGHRLISWVSTAWRPFLWSRMCVWCLRAREALQLDKPQLSLGSQAMSQQSRDHQHWLTHQLTNSSGRSRRLKQICIQPWSHRKRVFSHTAGRYSGWEVIPSAGTVQMSEPHVPWLFKLFVVIGHESARRSSEVHSNCREYLANIPLAMSVLPLWLIVGLATQAGPSPLW